jgi:hypothetical protein
MAILDETMRDAQFASLYAELRDIAKRELRRADANNAALSPTTVLHEAYLRLQQRNSGPLETEADFLSYAARVMRNLVIDSPAPFEMSPGTTQLTPSLLPICVTGGANVEFSNITLVLQAPAAKHFGTQAIHGVVVKCNRAWARESGDCAVQE